MNSLLQALYMTPEFRGFLYSWNYQEDLHGPREYCIPYQLQRLFAHLQLSRRRSVETRNLTKSFGWGQGMSFEQHDTQEFCRVLFDAIEQSFQLVGEQCTKIKELYEGQLQSYVKCSECGYESLNTDHYLDLSLAIKCDGGQISRSLHKALSNFIKPEELNGNNQYQCSECNKKVDAVKGLKIKSLPNILTIQLNRFTLDFSTFQMVKVHDRVVFPFALNGNQYLRGYQSLPEQVDYED